MLDDAINYLVSLISEGMEYPDAEWKTIRKFQLSNDDAQELREMYDYYHREE
jgi:hypothetical protein